MQRYWDQCRTHLPYLAILLFVVFSSVALNSRFNWVDDSYYIVLAKSLATGQGYTNIHLPHPTRHTHFPPGLPMLLALPMLLKLALGPTIILSKLVLIGCGALSLVAFARLVHLEGYDAYTTIWAVTLSALSVVLVTFTVRVASEMLYMLFSVVSLYAVQRYRQAAIRSRWGLLSSGCLALAILTRSVGVVLLGAVILNLAIKREFKRLIVVLAPAFIVMLAWLWHTHGSTGTSEYFKEFQFLYRSSRTSNWPLGLFAEPAANTWALISLNLPRTVASVLSSSAILSRPALAALTLPLRLALSLLALWQVVRSRSKVDSSADRFYIAFYLVLVLAYPWEPSRFVVPIVPFLCLYFVEGARAFFDGLGSRLGRARIASIPMIVSAVIAFCIACNLVSDTRFATTAVRTGDFSEEAAVTWSNAMEAYRWLDRNTPQSSVIGCAPTIEANVYLLADRKAMSLPVSADAWRPAGINYILVLEDRSTYGNVERRVENRVTKTLKNSVKSGELLPIYRNNSVVIYSLGERTASPVKPT